MSLLLSRQKLPVLAHTQVDSVAYGAYVLIDVDEVVARARALLQEE